MALGLAELSVAERMEQRHQYGIEGRASFGLKDQPRPALPVVLEGGVIPHGKKSWLRGKAYRETAQSLEALSMVLGEREGNGTFKRLIAESLAQHDRAPLAPSKVTVDSRVLVAHVPTPKGTKARKLSPR